MNNLQGRHRTQLLHWRYPGEVIVIVLTFKMTNLFLTIAALLIAGCNSGKQKDPALVEQLPIIKGDTTHSDTVVLNETFQQEDTTYNEYLVDRLKPIRKNFKRINSISRWTSTYKKELGESTEGGEATCYFSDGVLEKIVTRHFGKTFQQLTEYYLLNGQLSFVFEKSYNYNRPIYYDSSSMKENKDNQMFDFERSEIVEDRSYFEKGKLIHQVNNQDCGSPLAEDYLFEEQKRLTTDFDKLKVLLKRK
jgi:hypothetical protein